MVIFNCIDTLRDPDEFRLTISGNHKIGYKEKCRRIAGDEKDLHGDVFFITNALLTSFYSYLSHLNTLRPTIKDVEAPLLDFYSKITTFKLIFDKPVPMDVLLPWQVNSLNTPLYSQEQLVYEGDVFAGMAFIDEVLNIRNKIQLWLNPIAIKTNQGNLKNILNLPDYETTKQLEVNTFLYRCKQLNIYPDFVDGKLIRSYDSSGVLPLCWAEIWFALENNIMAGVCPYCYSIYRFNPKGLTKAHCGKKECRTAYLKDKNGSHWEAERKTGRPSGRKPGRPKQNIKKRLIDK